MAKTRISKAIGIDLGTTNSVVAIMNPNDTEIIIHGEGSGKSKRETTPSCVWKDPKNGQVYVGRRAYSRLGTPPEPIRSIKRLMGKPETVVNLTDEKLTPEEVSAYILREMKRQIEEDVTHLSTGSTEWIVDRAIVTVPAYFDQPQIEATRKAAEMAGLKVLELLHEPTAAACYHCWETNTQNGIFLVYDLGGGTFDVSVVRVIEGEFEVLGISGNKMLGGDDIDVLLAESLRQRLVDEGYDLHLDFNKQEDQLRFAKLKLLAEGVKIALSNSTEFVLRDQATLQDKQEERVNIDMTIERSELEQLITPFIERTIPCSFEALDKADKKAGITLADIDRIILAGGSTHIPLVREMVRKTFCADPSVSEPRAKCVEPVYKKVDTIVGLGAAIRASATGGLTISDAENTVRVAFRGIGATDMKQTYIGGIVEALNATTSIVGGIIKLAIPQLNYEDEQEIKGNGSFSFTRVPLQPSADNLLTFEVYDKRGTMLANIERSIYQSGQALRPTGGSTGTATLAKSIWMDVINIDVVTGEEVKYRQPLVKEGVVLPARVEFSSESGRVFRYRADASYIRLPVYQGSTMIKEIPVNVPAELEKDAEVRLIIEIDKLMNISAKGQVGNIVFDVQVLSASSRELPKAQDVQGVNKSFNAAVASLPSDKRSTAVAQYRRALQSYENAVKRNDNIQAVHEFEEMLEMVAKISTRETSLEPPKSVFDSLVKECLDLNRYAMQVSMSFDQPYDHRKMAQVIRTQQSEGEQAFTDNDQLAYTDVVEMLESILEHLRSLIGQAQQATDTRTEAQKATDFVHYLIGELSKFDAFVMKHPDKEAQSLLKQARLQLEAAEKEVHNNTQAVIAKALEMQVVLEKVRMILLNSPNFQENEDTKGLVRKDWL